MRAAASATLRTVPRVALAIPPRLRLRLVLLVLVAAALGAAYLFWFRDSSLVQVSEVKVTGLTTEGAPSIRRALTSAARDMTTLHVNESELRRAVAGNPAVREIRVKAGFPHSMTIRVVENRPVAVLAGSRTPVAPDGSELRGLPVEGPVAVLRGPPALAVVPAAAPGPIAQRISYVRRAPRRGVVARLRHGPLVVLGDTSDLGVKWRAATRVLADSDAQGATYIDVSLPERPVAGGLGVNTIEPLAPAGSPQQGPPPTTPDPAPQAGSPPVQPTPANPQPVPQTQTPP